MTWSSEAATKKEGEMQPNLCRKLRRQLCRRCSLEEAYDEESRTLFQTYLQKMRSRIHPF